MGWQGWLLATLLGGMFLGNVDLAIVNIAAPSLQEDRGAGAGPLPAMHAFRVTTLAMAATALLAGVLAHLAVRRAAGARLAS